MFVVTDDGKITVAAQGLNYEAATSYTLTVLADSGVHWRATGTVNVTVTNVFEQIPAPSNFVVTKVAGGFDLSWDAEPHANRYAVQYKAALNADGEYMPNSFIDVFTEDTSLELRPDSVTCA